MWELVLLAFRKENPPLYGKGFDEWAADAAQRFGIEINSVRAIIAYQLKRDREELESKQPTKAQQMGELHGATLVEAMAAIARALNATKRRPVMVKGLPVRDPETKEFLWLETPDYPTQLAAAKTVLDVEGGYMPQKIEVEHGISADVKALTEEALLARLAEAKSRVERAMEGAVIEVQAIESATGRRIGSGTQASAPQSGTGDAGAGQRIGVSTRPAGAVLLADGTDQDEG